MRIHAQLQEEEEEEEEKGVPVSSLFLCAGVRVRGAIHIGSVS